MDEDRARRLASEVLARHGRTFAAEARVGRLSDTPAPLFRLLVVALLLSARIRAATAVAAARALFESGWTTPEKLVGSTWRARTDVLNGAGYGRYDESTSRLLGRTAAQLVERHGGDLRRLRRRAGGDPAVLGRLLEEFPGIGPVGADIFRREVQGVWDELYPFVDDRVGRTAGALGLPRDAAGLAHLVDRTDFPALLAGLVRVELAGQVEEIRRAAPGGR